MALGRNLRCLIFIIIFTLGSYRLNVASWACYLTTCIHYSTCFTCISLVWNKKWACKKQKMRIVCFPHFRRINSFLRVFGRTFFVAMEIRLWLKSMKIVHTLYIESLEWKLENISNAIVFNLLGRYFDQIAIFTVK